MSDRLVKAISVPRGGKTDIFFQDAKRAGKNISALVCGIIERHSTLYDDNIRLEEENRQLLYDYHTIVSAALEALDTGGEKWELYFPPDSAVKATKLQGNQGYGLAARVHFKKAEQGQSSNDS